MVLERGVAGVFMLSCDWVRALLLSDAGWLCPAPMFIAFIAFMDTLLRRDAVDPSLYENGLAAILFFSCRVSNSPASSAFFALSYDSIFALSRLSALPSPASESR